LSMWAKSSVVERQLEIPTAHLRLDGQFPNGNCINSIHRLNVEIVNLLPATPCTK
jgi:hypothetical protein